MFFVFLNLIIVFDELGKKISEEKTQQEQPH